MRAILDIQKIDETSHGNTVAILQGHSFSLSPLQVAPNSILMYVFMDTRRRLFSIASYTYTRIRQESTRDCKTGSSRREERIVGQPYQLYEIQQQSR